jgi:5-methylcytosine-specific restriction protein B
MARYADFPQETYVAMQRIRETALIRFDSLFTPGKKLWTLENLGKFHTLFVERLDLGEGSFLEKWRKQLEGAADDILQLAAELLYVQQFFTTVTGPERKLENVKTVLDWCSRPASIPEWAIVGANRGLARDQSFNQQRPFHLAWLNEYLIHWQELPRVDQNELLNDPWRFAQDVHAVNFSGGAYQPMQEAWLYIAFPDSFEDISSRKYKQRIRDAFHDRLENGSSGNIDKDLLEIRKSLTSQYGEGFYFYRSPIVEQWQQANQAENDVEVQIHNQISRQDILDAIAALDRGEPHTFGPSTFYDLLEGGRRYPPKAVVGLAARRALGRPLRPDEFSGGQESWAFRLLRNRGFQIIGKDRATNIRTLPSVPPPRVWIEDTKSAYAHGGPGWEFGSCLWSPSANEVGSDQYAVMREPKIDDLIIHINDGNFVGFSNVSAPFREVTEAPPSPGPWAARPAYYRIDLKDYHEFP